MRLIDADELKKVLCEEYEAREHYIGEKMLDAIDNAPTVEEPERPKGECCGSCYLCDVGDCGADMREEGAENEQD